VQRSGDIGLLQIVSETGIAAGVRRIEAVTGLAALHLAQGTSDLLARLCEQLRATPAELPERTERLQQQLRELGKQIVALEGRVAAAASGQLLAQARTFGSARVLAAEVAGHEGEALLALGDRLREALGSGALLLASVQEGKVMLVCMVTRDLHSSLKAGELIKQIAPLVGGAGGGAPHMAKAGGRKPEGVPAALARFEALVQEALGA
jgi:alanyl-tRNA synthetase